jgi:DNA-binding MarR family transcriptional regulator
MTVAPEPFSNSFPPAGAARDRLRLWLRLLRLTRQVEADLRERLRVHHQMTLPRFDVLAALHRSPEGMRMSQLSRKLEVSNGNVTGIIDRLVADGLVLRSIPDGDRRASVVRLTEAGRRRFEAIAAEHNRWVDELLSAAGPHETIAAIALIDRLIRRDAKA